MPSWLSYSLSIAATMFGAALPMVTAVIPPPYNLLASVAVTGLGSLYHLLQPSPKSANVVVASK